MIRLINFDVGDNMNIELQELLFSSPTRKQLLDYTPTLPKKYTVQVFRNHSFEFVEHTIYAYLEYGQLGVNFEYSGYDDTLSFIELNTVADALILWLDVSRYHSESQFRDLLISRMKYLRSIYTKPVLLVPFGAEVCINMPSLLVFNLQEIQAAMGSAFLDERASAITGTSLSRKAMLVIAKELGLRYIPALLRPALKAVVVDFDNTLYSGVLGEDGICGIQLTDGHIRLQKQLKKLAESGIMLCAASKNEPQDIVELLEKNSDFVLRQSDFTKLCISWQPKTQSIQEIAQYLNIGVDSMVFVDDNIGELKAVTMAFPQIKAIHAEEDANKTADVLSNFPGLTFFATEGQMLSRKDDIISNEERKKIMAKADNKTDYLKSLGISLEFQKNNINSAKRISELANKTNQFIFNYKRYSEAELYRSIEREDMVVISVSLSDILSDSGLIAACVGRKENDVVILEECFMSCRAMGRGIEDAVILGAIQYAAETLACKMLHVCFQDGPRNAPAKLFVETYLRKYLTADGYFSYQIPTELMNVKYD